MCACLRLCLCLCRRVHAALHYIIINACIVLTKTQTKHRQKTNVGNLLKYIILTFYIVFPFTLLMSFSHSNSNIDSDACEFRQNV